ncbi:hypothetical protein PF004_g22266 [Phytophthora fragariae]|uniref:Uncharacterized protein n=1 Tax=Phytophthora fragariae TaxID=53985 RepID=A0A6G0N1D7_9STRA|nr:hypothetical protein PF004_g22266 [Phytophthora fragariae]
MAPLNASSCHLKSCMLAIPSLIILWHSCAVIRRDTGKPSFRASMTPPARAR